ncbi:MAG: hypothetical protein FWD44_06085 [Oscillospiraceae bacterium]|nr:hypothetical protein [Oscillospiraceae bacterium]
MPRGTDPLNAEQGIGLMGVGQSGTNAIVVVDIITIVVDIAVGIDVRGIITIVAGRPKPPPVITKSLELTPSFSG